MTNSERAEKMLEALMAFAIDREGDWCDKEYARGLLISRLDEAQREAVSKVPQQQYALDAEWHRKRGYETGFSEGFADAISQAAKTAEAIECSIARGTEVCNCDIEIADAIRSLKQNESKP